MSSIFDSSNRDILIRVWENERKSRDLCATLMWENVKYFATLFGALLVAHMALLAFFWPIEPGELPSDIKASVLIFPLAIIAVSVYAYFDLRRRWDRFLLVAAQLCKLEVLLGLHDDIGEKLDRYQKENLSCFKEDKFLFKDYRRNLYHANSDNFRLHGIRWRVRNGNMLTSMGSIYWITIAIGIGLMMLDMILIYYMKTQ
jgi:hypothetical protein